MLLQGCHSHQSSGGERQQRPRRGLSQVLSSGWTTLKETLGTYDNINEEEEGSSDGDEEEEAVYQRRKWKSGYEYHLDLSNDHDCHVDANVKRFYGRLIQGSEISSKLIIHLSYPSDPKLPMEVLRQALSHRNLKATTVYVRHYGNLGSYDSYNDVGLILNALLTAENNAVRELELEFKGWGWRRQTMAALAPALKHPNCRVDSINFEGFKHPGATLAFLSLIKTAVECKHSRLSAIRFNTFVYSQRGVRRLGALLDYRPKGSNSPKITGLAIRGIHPPTADNDDGHCLQFLFRHALTPKRLSRLKQFDFRHVRSWGPGGWLAHQLAVALQQSSNKLRDLSLENLDQFPPEFAQALRQENCKLQRFHVYDYDATEPTGFMGAVAASLNGPNCTLRHLDYYGPDLQDNEIFRAIIRAIRGGTRLKTLKLCSNSTPLCPGLGRELMAAMKETPNTIRSLRLEPLIMMDPAVVIDLLQSPNCHLSCLNISGKEDVDPYWFHLPEFKRAARIRNFWQLRVGQNNFYSLLYAMTMEKWYEVMIAITSVHHIPRLRSEKCPLGMIPVGTFLPVIVKTLGWPLDRLR